MPQSQWEYRELDLCNGPGDAHEAALLNELGAQGWVLIAITANNTAYLKRQLAAPHPSRKRSAGASDEVVDVGH